MDELKDENPKNVDEVEFVEKTGVDEIKEEQEEEVEEDEEALPHSEFLDIFEEGLALMVQDPLLCDLPIQVYHQTAMRSCFNRIILKTSYMFDCNNS